MKKKHIAMTLLIATALSVGLSGCGEKETQVLEKRVTAGQDAHNATEKLNELNQKQSDEVNKYLDK